jgi:hypothetical protein
VAGNEAVAGMTEDGERRAEDGPPVAERERGSEIKVVKGGVILIGYWNKD